MEITNEQRKMLLARAHGRTYVAMPYQVMQMMKRQLQIGDLISIRESASLWSPEDIVGVTGIVVGTTLEDQRTPDAEDYWIRVVFLDGTISTLFHDEVKVLAKK